ncbi:hypothetical protein, partial [Nostoc sp. UHCC 0251]|uniref:hypothetical protein n=1 Tax=Nostoc sp. UHCC 0251 TaxID=3110240 RepID=UPI002B1F72C0
YGITHPTEIFSEIKYDSYTGLILSYQVLGMSLFGEWNHARLRPLGFPRAIAMIWYQLKTINHSRLVCR